MKSVPPESPTRVPCRCPTRVAHKIVPKECLKHLKWPRGLETARCLQAFHVKCFGNRNGVLESCSLVAASVIVIVVAEWRSG